MYEIYHNITIRVLPMNAFFVTTTEEFLSLSVVAFLAQDPTIICSCLHAFYLGRGWRRLDIDFCISLLSAVVA